MRSVNQTHEEIQESLARLAPHLARAASDTAGAFFCSEATLSTRRPPRFSDLGALRASQKNVGDNYEMTCNLAVDQAEWDRLFSAGESEVVKRDAFNELANCICGAVLAHPGFSEAFGWLVPCVPGSGPSLVPAGSSRLNGALVMGGAWIRFSFCVNPMAAQLGAARPLVAAAA